MRDMPPVDETINHRRTIEMPTPFARVDAPPRRDIAAFAPPHPSPSIDGAVIGLVEPGDATRGKVAEALGAAKLAAHRSREAAIAIHGDATLSEGGRHVKSNEVSYKTTHAALPHLDAAGVAIEMELIRLRAKTKGPPVDGSVKANMQYAERRSALAAMTQEARMKANLGSLDEGDDMLVCAALDASRFLTGLSKIEQAHIRELWAQKRLPAEVACISLLEKDAERLRRAGSLLISFQQKCADQSIIAAARASADAATAAIGEAVRAAG